MSRIILPTTANVNDLKRNEPVTHGELDDKLVEMEDDFNRMARTLEMISTRVDALVRGLTNPLVYLLDHSMHLDYEKFYRYTEKMTNKFIPALIKIITETRTVSDRCYKAQEWNELNQDMPMGLDDLMIMNDAQMATPLDIEAMKLVRGSESFWEAWKANGGTRP